MRPRITIFLNNKKTTPAKKAQEKSGLSMPSLFEGSLETETYLHGYANVIELSPKVLKLSGGFRRLKTV